MGKVLPVAMVFDLIYRTNYWRGTESRSGRGSGTQAIRSLAPRLVQLIQELGVTSVLDVGCGDGFWLPPLPGYVGLDVSGVALALARQRHPDWDYRLDDGGAYPRCQLVMARHVMQHLSFSQGARLISRVRESGAEWFLATTYLTGINKDIITGRFYWPDLRAAPFSLGDPDAMLEDEGGAPPERMARLGLWRLR